MFTCHYRLALRVQRCLFTGRYFSLLCVRIGRLSTFIPCLCAWIHEASSRMPYSRSETLQNFELPGAFGAEYEIEELLRLESVSSKAVEWHVVFVWGLNKRP